jgi:hypothetical protein
MSFCGEERKITCRRKIFPLIRLCLSAFVHGNAGTLSMAFALAFVKLNFPCAKNWEKSRAGNLGENDGSRLEADYFFTS